MLWIAPKQKDTDSSIIFLTEAPVNLRRLPRLIEFPI